MSNDLFRVAVAGIVLMQLAGLLWAILVPRGRRAVMLVNLLLAAGVLIYWVPSLPAELARLARAEQTEFPDSYEAPLLCLIELATLIASALRLSGRCLPGTGLVVWLGFAFNFCVSLGFAAIAFLFEFHCCGYL
jgi:hypothetical protein